jgi:dipeptidyl aminopeptidase/acylaminoacyl peptidase
MARTPLVPSDLYKIVIHGDPRITPREDIYYTRTVVDEKKNAPLTSIWRARPAAPPARFTAGEKDSLPRPSPDGSILAFASDRGEGSRIYLMSADGGEARALTGEYPSIAALVWSPAGDRLAFVATAAHEPQTAGVYHDEESGARHVRSLPYKSDSDGLLDGRRRHLFVVAIDGGEAKQQTSGNFDVAAPAWSPDGTKIAFASLRGHEETRFASDLFALDLASGAIEKLTDSAGTSTAPAYSHDGKNLAYVGHRRGDEGGGGRYNLELFVMPSSGGEARSLTASLDRTIGDWISSDVRSGFGVQAPIWSSDDGELFVAMGFEGATLIVGAKADGSGTRRLTGTPRQMAAFARNAAGTIAFAASEPTEPSAIVRLDADGEQKVTADNLWLEDRTVRAPRRMRPLADDGTELDVWILDPDEPDGAPLVLEIHGGPHAAYGASFFLEFQILAGHGMGVAYGNPRGSQTYGDNYANCITGDWGNVDASDVLNLLDAAEANGRWDKSRIGIAGGSYGGFMTSWLLGHSKRFAAGVSMRAVNEFATEFAVSDIHRWIGEEIGAPWTDGGRALFERSPMRAAHEIDVPLLIDHSDRDYRCPIDQGEQLFTLLRVLGRKNVEFVRFTGDGHELSRSGKPRSRVLRLRAIAHWFIRHLKPAGIDAVADEAGALFKPLATETVASA